MPRFTDFSASGLTLKYQVVGQGSPVILVHGLSGSGRWWRYNVAALAQKHTVYILDLAGYGHANRQRTVAVQDLARLVADWITDLDLQDVALIGHSMGGHISLHVTALVPQRISHLVLVAASGLLRGNFYRSAARLPRAAVKGRLNFIPRIMWDGLRAGLPNLWLSTNDLLRDDTTPLLAGIGSRTLLIWGGEDVLVPPSLGESYARALPGSQYVLIPFAGHVVMVDAPQTFNRLVLEFLHER